MLDIAADLPSLLADIHTRIFNPARIPFAVCAIFIVMGLGFFTGPFRGNAQPLLWQGVSFLFGRVGDKLGNPHRLRADLVFRGFMLTCFVVLIAVSLGRAAEIFTQIYPVYALPEILFVSLCLSGGALWKSLMKLYGVLEKPGSEKGVYYVIAQTTRANLNSTDNYGITRAGLALAARAFDKGLVAPVLWYLIGGLPFVFTYSALAALAWRFGKDGFSKGFGAVPSGLEKALGFVPSIFAGFLLTLASIITPAAGIGRSVISWFSFKNAAPYAQGGLPLSVMAYALNVSLGGPVKDLNGSALKNVWAGPSKASAKVDYHHLKRGLFIVMIACIFWLVTLLGCYIWAGRSGMLNIIP
ncbi:MAG: cobalamin biosynthesis protein [Alphaproteobacteria bacterium]|nr:cobalamin biosynthesis protein [Alphaproteobacteria bacterium]MCD8571563.1 cobalamin biosynthesis protein [Alphaproteobacteria bacterium]